MTSVTFSINGTQYSVPENEFQVTTSMLTFIRNHARLPGTKFSCLEGGCGACMVNVKAIHPVTNELETYAVNSCLKPIYTCDGLEITTIEGIGGKKTNYHAIQRRLNQAHGSQCGYCTPGMVVNMFSLLAANNDKVSVAEIERSFDGNICRCTGYRPILDACKSFGYDADQSLVNACKDIDLAEMDIEEISSLKCGKSVDKKCADVCRILQKAMKPLEIVFTDGRQWFRPLDVPSIVDIFDKIQDLPYMLVAGNTAHGVFRIHPNLQVFIDINAVPELHAHVQAASTLKIGGNVSIREAMQILRKAAKLQGFEYCEHLAIHMDKMANIGVRNTGTLAGNFSLKHAFNEFPSDLFTIFSAAGATVKIVGVNSYREIVTPDQYLAIDMTHKLILNFTLYKLCDIHYRSYKVTIRAQNAHAYVNAAFNVRMENGTVAETRICFGGINPKFCHAKATEAILISRDLFNATDLETIMTCLQNELHPDWYLPDASPEYRKNLALSLFYRFVLNICPNIRPQHVSGSRQLVRPISSGTQSYETFEKKYPLTKPVEKYEGLLQCAGEAIYVNDIPPMRDELWASFVVGTKVKSKIAEIDISEAMAMPGVRHFYSAKDIPGNNNFTPVSYYTSVEEEIFVGVDSEVMFHSQPVGIIVADTMALAIEAATKVKILYKVDKSSSMLTTARNFLIPLFGEVAEPPVIPTIKEAFELNARDRFRPMAGSRKATNVGLNATKKISGVVQIYGQYHHHMETQTCICVPSEDGMDVYSSTQWVDFTQIAIADCLGISANKINMQVRRIGGGFGGKLSRQSQIACACALACHLSKRPIRFVMTMEANMKSIGKRYGLYGNYDLTVDDNGQIQELTNEYSQDYGCSMNESVAEPTSIYFSNVYDSSRWSVTPQAVLTESPSNTFMRGPCAVEGIAMIENIMEHIAKAVDRDPMDVRMLHYPTDHPMKEMSADFLVDIDYKQRQEDIVKFNAKNRWIKRGLAVVPMQYFVISYGSMPAFVAIYHHDGSVVVSHGGIECGQGINTKAAQVAAYALGIPLDLVSVRSMSNVISANATWTGASSTSDMVCHAIKVSCDELMKRMKPIRDAMPDGYKWFELTQECHKQFIDLRATAQNKENDMGMYPVYGLSAAEMEVDILTGMYQLRRVDIVEDVGESLSPMVDVGQIEGGFVMGMGYWLSEKLVYDRMTSELLTDRSWTYKPPGAMDIPIDFRINFLRKSPIPTAGVLGAKAVGEPATCMAVVVVFALRNALYAARKDAGLPDEFFPMGSACTPEQVFLHSGFLMENLKL